MTERQAFTDLSDGELQAEITRLREQDLQLRNRRAREGTLGDTLQGHDTLIRGAEEVINRGWGQQANELRRTGRSGVGGFNLLGHFAQAWVILQDHAGEQRLLKAIKGRAYPMTLQEYQKRHAANVRGIADMELELSERDLRRRQAALEAERSHRLGQIEEDVVRASPRKVR